MNKKLALLVTAAALLVSAGRADIVVDRSQTVGKIKPMNGVNNGPAGPIGNGNSQQKDNFATYKAARFPFARTHDAAFSESYGSEHTVDITAIFPDFSRKADDPTAYDFAITDWYLDRIRQMGTEVFFRLGQKIEHHVKKYGINPPKDFRKWALVCEHIIRHYNEGWADGHHWNIRYWEIWNEADLAQYDPEDNRLTWGGTQQQFFDFYTIAAKHLKKCFPNLKIGGPAFAGEYWMDAFMQHMVKERVPIDFFSWHQYATKPQTMGEKARRIRQSLDKYGYKDTETTLNEWNYVRNWTNEFLYSIRSMRNQKGAAFCSAVMSVCQDAPVDILMYYDARPETVFNGLFDMYTMHPTPAYYPFYAWSRLAELGTQVKVTNGEKDLYATAATTADGEGALRVLLSYYTDDDNTVRRRSVTISMPGTAHGTATGHVIDSGRLYTEIPLEVKDGSIALKMEPNSVVMIEIPAN
ncbi:MAG: hypothetical protein II484_01265 [Bacteroidaceae bacterium]|nr:hypothetical protein [Bacteroidaceae bacterium]